MQLTKLGRAVIAHDARNSGTEEAPASFHRQATGMANGETVILLTIKATSVEGHI